MKEYDEGGCRMGNTHILKKNKPLNLYPDAPCMDYIPTSGEKWLHSRGNVGKYSLHGAFGLRHQ